MVKGTQIYLPVTHSNGTRLVQVTNEDGGFCGWADGAGPYAHPGTWTIDDLWSPGQAGQLGHVIQVLTGFARKVTTEADGVARKVTARL